MRLLSDREEEATIRVAVVDDQRLFTKGLSGLVDMLDGVEVVGVAYDGEEALALCRKEEPDVVLMDISMPKMDGISATREIKDLLPQTHSASPRSRSLSLRRERSLPNCSATLSRSSWWVRSWTVLSSNSSRS